MSQIYENIPVTEKMYDSLSKLLERDNTGVTLSSGTSFPQEIESWMLGRMCLRTDLKALYYLSSTNPVKWDLVIDFSQTLVTKSYVDKTFQPLNSNLTALSQLKVTPDTIPYFNSATTMSALSLNSFTRSLLNVQNASDTRNLLGLGALATVDKINSSNVNSMINNSTIPASKLNFTPITAGEGYTVGDIKESYNSAWEDGYINLYEGYTIGDGSSGATFTGNQFSNLYLTIWGSGATKTYYANRDTEVAKGSSATVDWNAHKKLSLPYGFSYINPYCTYKIRWL